jgi:soluble lytic murein transglycosylase-like protein
VSAAVEGVGAAGVPSAAGLASASATAARVAELQSLIETVEGGAATGASRGATGASFEGAASFGAQLDSATAVGSGSVGSASESSGSASAPPFASLIEAASARYGIDPALLAGVIHQESNFDPDAGSPAGAQGLTQLMPETARGLGVTNPYDPVQAIDGGARLIGEKLQEFGGDVELALAAYNAGSGAVHQYDGIPPYPETQAYVQKVLGYAGEYTRGGAFGSRG